MSIFDSFRIRSNPAPARVEPTVADTPAPAPTANVAKPAPTSPLENHATLWQAPEKPPVEPTLAPTMNIDPAKIAEVAKQVNFTQNFDPAMLAKAAGGDAESLALLINQAAQNGYATALQSTGAIIRTALDAQGKRLTDTVAPALIRDNAIREEVSRNIALADHPAARPIVDSLTKQISAKFPAATPAEVNTHVAAYLNDFATTVVANNGGVVTTRDQLAAATKANPRAAETDWSTWFANDSLKVG